MDFNFTEPDLIECQKEWDLLDPETRIQLNHFDLADMTAIKDTQVWIKFLSDTRVAEALKVERRLYLESIQNRLVAKSQFDSRSTGAAQMIGALGRVQAEDKAQVGGDTFIYTYVPANIHEKHADNYNEEDRDIFGSELQ